MVCIFKLLYLSFCLYMSEKYLFQHQLFLNICLIKGQRQGMYFKIILIFFAYIGVNICFVQRENTPTAIFSAVSLVTITAKLVIFSVSL